MRLTAGPYTCRELGSRQARSFAQAFFAVAVPKALAAQQTHVRPQKTWMAMSTVGSSLMYPPELTVAAYVEIDAKTPISVAGGMASAGHLYLRISRQMVKPSTKYETTCGDERRGGCARVSRRPPAL